MKRAWMLRKKKKKADASAAHGVAHVNGHASDQPEIAIQVHPIHHKKLLKETVRAFAIEGAKTRLAQLDREREVLQMFIKSGEKTS